MINELKNPGIYVSILTINGLKKLIQLYLEFVKLGSVEKILLSRGYILRTQQDLQAIREIAEGLPFTFKTDTSINDPLTFIMFYFIKDMNIRCKECGMHSGYIIQKFRKAYPEFSKPIRSKLFRKSLYFLQTAKLD